MNIVYAFLADAASTPNDGKVYVLGGGIDTLGALEFPVAHPNLALVLKIGVHPMECDRPHVLSIELWDADGQVLTRVGGEFAAQRHPRFPARAVYAQLVLNIQGLHFPKAGEYDFQIAIDGQHYATVPLFVDQVKVEGSVG